MNEWIDELRIKINTRETNGKTKSWANRSTDNQRDCPTTSSLLIDQRKTCSYCKRHYSCRCNAFTDIAARKKILKNENKRCVCTRSELLAKESTN